VHTTFNLLINVKHLSMTLTCKLHNICIHPRCCKHWESNSSTDVVNVPLSSTHDRYSLIMVPSTSNNTHRNLSSLNQALPQAVDTNPRLSSASATVMLVSKLPADQRTSSTRARATPILQSFRLSRQSRIKKSFVTHRVTTLLVAS